MGIFQFLIFIAFLLVYVALVGALIVRLAARREIGFFRKSDNRENEVPIRG